MTAEAGRKSTLGLFITSAEDKYENAILCSVAAVARAEGLNLICYTSGALSSYHGFEAQRNVLYSLVNTARISGLVISGTLSHNVSQAEMSAFCATYAPLPRVSIALNLESIPSVRADGRSGIRAITEHLIVAHGFRKIGFLRGPAGQQEAEERYSAYRETLAAHGLPAPANLVLAGDYTQGSGRRAMSEFLKLGLPCEALVSANDAMALGALEVCREHGLRLPADLAICGFDNTEAGRFQTPALTSVNQSVYEQGTQAAQTLLKCLAGEPVPTNVTTPAVLVVRRSCGCQGFPAAQPTPEFEPGQTQAQKILATLRRELVHLPAAQVEAWAAEWLAAFSSDLTGATREAFPGFLEAVSLAGQKAGVDLETWEHALTQVRRLGWAGAPTTVAPETLWEAGRERLAGLAEKIQVLLRTQSEQWAVILREISETMLTTTALSELLEVVATELPRLGISSCFLSLYQNPDEPEKLARLVLAYDRQGRFPLPAEGLLFPSPELAPALVWERQENYSLVVEALYSKENRLGFVLFEVAPEQAAICSALRGQLSGALQGVLLLQEWRRVELELRETQGKLEEQVLLRTQALRKTNVKLQKEVAERQEAQAEVQLLNAELEKRVIERTAELEAANQELESFSYSVSHDLRAPLRAVLGFARILEEDFGAQLGPDGRQHLERIGTNAHRMSQLIDNLLTFSRLGRQTLRKQTLAPTELVHQVLADFQPLPCRGQVEFKIAELPPCQADPALLRQVFDNLLGNALKYSSKRAAACIEVGWHADHQETVYFVRDNGAGFDMRYASKLFGVFQRLHREDEFEGTGVGLAIVQRILSRHGGRIWAEGQVGQGATFYFTVGKTQ